ncbi:hypothetical protein LCGC14_0680210 [marine sediment metagenome]|uniref:GIY-YIG domain-containing protein n=1 Tax=marine sediment metagenome TaxID=412755 RepID=A0A0F9TWE1_9ZZZZ
MIINNKNGKRYIGSACHLDSRESKHRTTLARNKHDNSHLQRVWNKYGEDAFDFKVMMYCDPENLILFEQKFMDFYKPEYNLRPKAESNFGMKFSDKARKNMSLAHIGIIPSKESREKRSKSLMGHPGYWKGKQRSSETKRKISEFHLGKKLTDEHKRKLSDAKRGKRHHFYGKKLSEEHKRKISLGMKKFRSARS